jgi:cellulose biosynthesis protein BcsQ
MIIAMVNAKGGVGKTTCTCNLAHALALKGKRVLVIDNDPQANATSLLLGDQTPGHTLFNLLESSMVGSEPDLFTEGQAPAEGPSVPIESCIYPTLLGLDVIPNSTDSATLEFDLYQNAANYGLLRRITRTYAQANYDFCLIDCPPTLGVWVVMAMVAGDAVIVPVEAGSRMALDGLASVYTAVEKASKKANTELTFLRALINKVDLRTSASKLIVETMRKRFPGKTFETTIPVNTSIQQAEIYRTTVLKHDPQCNGSKRFRALADELITLTDLENKAKDEVNHGG